MLLKHLAIAIMAVTAALAAPIDHSPLAGRMLERTPAVLQKLTALCFLCFLLILRFRLATAVAQEVASSVAAYLVAEPAVLQFVD